MNIRKLTLSAAVLAFALPLAARAASPMKAGKWQMTTQMEMAGMSMQMPPIVTTTCVTKEQAENPQPPKQNAECKFSDYKMEGNSISWTIDCPKQKMSGSGKITYGADTYTGTMKMKVGDREMSGKYTGKRLGDCDK
jgi:uncharacterized protein DUF3617